MTPLTFQEKATLSSNETSESVIINHYIELDAKQSDYYTHLAILLRDNYDNPKLAEVISAYNLRFVDHVLLINCWDCLEAALKSAEAALKREKVYEFV